MWWTISGIERSRLYVLQNKTQLLFISIHPTIPAFAHTSNHPSLPPSFLSCIRLSFQHSFLTTLHLSFHLSNPLTIHISTYLSNQQFIYSCTYPSIYLSILSIIHDTSVFSFMYISTHLTIHNLRTGHISEAISPTDFILGTKVQPNEARSMTQVPMTFT